MSVTDVPAPAKEEPVQAHRPRWRRTAVIVALAVLCTIGILHLLRSQRQERFGRMRGAVSTCLQDMGDIGLALALYREDHDGKWPQSLHELVPRYLTRMPTWPAD